MGVYKAPKFIKFKNVSKHRVVVEDLGIDVAPGEVCDVQEGYAMPRLSHAGDRFPSVLEHLAGCGGCAENTNGQMPDGSPNHRPHCLLLPLEDKDRDRFNKAPKKGPAEEGAPKLPTVSDLVASGMPRGVAEQMVKAMHAVIASAAGEVASDEDETEEPKAPKAPKAEPKAKPEAK